MRINRQRKVNRILRFYFNNFGFKKPFKVLMDGTFCHSALESKINITDQLTKYLSGDVRVVTTSCAILEIEKLGPSVYGAMLILKQFPVHQCGHKQPIFGASCFKSMLGKTNQYKYMLATQDRDLQDYARKIPGLPLLYIFNKAPTMDFPNEASVYKASEHIHKSCSLSNTEAANIKEMKKVLLPPQERRTPFKRKRTKGPNPLSCKKKQKKSNNNNKKKGQESGKK